MKFAKELDQELVPEWRAKYLNYKLGKKKVKAVARAVRDVQKTTPRTPYSLRRDGPASPNFEVGPQYTYLNRGPAGQHPARAHEVNRRSPGEHQVDRPELTSVRSISGERTAPQDSHPLRPKHGNRNLDIEGMTRYGSIIGSPSQDSPLASRMRKREDAGKAPSLRLPDPAMDPLHSEASQTSQANSRDLASPASAALTKVASNVTAAGPYEAGQTKHPPPKKVSLSARHFSIFRPKRINSTPGPGSKKPIIRRILSMGGPPDSLPPSGYNVPLEVYREIDVRQAEFFNFLDLELEKIETFYKEKEDEATERLKVLRDQLHIMRDRRMEELIRAKAERIKAKRHGVAEAVDAKLEGARSQVGSILPSKWLRTIDHAFEAAKSGRFGATTKAMTELGTPSGPRAVDASRDYVRRATISHVPYRAAKRKLKVAMQEYYRALELLKSYALLNRMAFRKINKKYDKAVNARPSNRYMQEKVNKSYFVESEVLDGHIRAVEDLYARYFEGGNYKVAASKLRAKAIRPDDYTISVFRNGLSVAAGLVFGIQGLVYGAQLLFSNDAEVHVRTSYLLQIYAGYFLMLILVLMFGGACRFWTRSKVNFVFVFEFDTRHHLDWRQLFEIPCFFFFLLGLVMWLNFNQFGGAAMYTYYPVILIGLTAIILFLPAPYIYHRTREWFLYSCWRLSFAGLYPVEFRDFFLGDMFCSLTYAMGNIELFFCLYARAWADPAMCNSSHSRLLGFFSALPGVWRALQCLRRYYDTRNVFPHLVNCGKYTWTILFYMSLSLYRIDKTYSLRAFFIFAATINSVYCTIWDLVMDWSLFDPTAKHRFLRRELAYKQIWLYYVAIVVDPILRFNWIFYAIFAQDLQHSALLSFAVALSEAFRRGLWMLFRVENEHCTNVRRYRASRDIPLPYEVRDSTPLLAGQSHPTAIPEEGGESASPSHDEEAQVLSVTSHIRDSATPLIPGKMSSEQDYQTADTVVDSAPVAATPTGFQSSAHQSNIRQRKPSAVTASTGQSPFIRGINRVGTILRMAHAQDFERKRRPGLGQDASVADVGNESTDEEHEGSEDEDVDEIEAADNRRAQEILRHVEVLDGMGAEDDEDQQRWASIVRDSMEGNGTVRRSGRPAQGSAEESDELSPGNSL